MTAYTAITRITQAIQTRDVFMHYLLFCSCRYNGKEKLFVLLIHCLAGYSINTITDCDHCDHDHESLTK